MNVSVNQHGFAASEMLRLLSPGIVKLPGISLYLCGTSSSIMHTDGTIRKYNSNIEYNNLTQNTVKINHLNNYSTTVLLNADVASNMKFSLRRFLPNIFLTSGHLLSLPPQLSPSMIFPNFPDKNG